MKNLIEKIKNIAYALEPKYFPIKKKYSEKDIDAIIRSYKRELGRKFHDKSIPVWGDAAQCCGHSHHAKGHYFGRTLSVGDFILMPSKRVFEVTSVRWCGNPSDMYFWEGRAFFNKNTFDEIGAKYEKPSKLSLL